MGPKGTRRGIPEIIHQKRRHISPRVVHGVHVAGVVAGGGGVDLKAALEVKDEAETLADPSRIVEALASVELRRGDDLAAELAEEFTYSNTTEK